MRLETSYLGLDLAHPLIADASSMPATHDDLRRMEAAGASAIVTRAPDEQQMAAWYEALDAAGTVGAESHPEVTSYLPPLCGCGDPRAAHLEMIRRAAECLSVPLIAGLCATSPQAAIAMARDLEAAGASAIEIDFFRLAADPDETSADVERQLIGTVRAVRDAVKLPIAVRLRPVFSAPTHLAHALAEAGANGLTVRSGPATQHGLGMALLWMSLLSQRLALSLAVASDAMSAETAVECLLAGADAIIVAAAQTERGDHSIGRLQKDLGALIEMLHMRTLDEFRRNGRAAGDQATVAAAAAASRKA